MTDYDEPEEEESRAYLMEVTAHIEGIGSVTYKKRSDFTTDPVLTLCNYILRLQHNSDTKLNLLSATKIATK